MKEVTEMAVVAVGMAVKMVMIISRSLLIEHLLPISSQLHLTAVVFAISSILLPFPSSVACIKCLP